MDPICAIQSRRFCGAAALAVLTKSSAKKWCNPRMTLLILEALGALLIFVLIIWWTMFHGRNKGERKDEDQ